MDWHGSYTAAGYLNNQNIMRPAAYAVEQGHAGYERYFEGNEGNRYAWSENGVRGILRSPVYAGHLVGYKRPTISMRSRKRPSRLPEEWETVQNTHETIVSQEVFDTVQRLVTSRRKKSEWGYDNIFAGIIKCADCGFHLTASRVNRSRRPDLIECIVYRCGYYNRYGTSFCSPHSIEAQDLYNAVLADINHHAEMAMNDPKAVKAIQQRLSAMDASEAKAYEREKRKLSKRLTELDKLFVALYEDKVMERITERNFALMSEKYEKEQLDIDARLKSIEAELAAKGIADRGAADFVSLIQSYQGISELTAATVNALIDKITISERAKNENGDMEQHVTIYYKFIGTIHECLHMPVPKRKTIMGERLCTICGVVYRPGSHVAKYCPTCRNKAYNASRDASKARSRARARAEKEAKAAVTSAH